MITGSFDAKTAREFVGDALARHIEQSARADAERDNFAPPCVGGRNYAESLHETMQAILYREQFTRRLARLQRTTNKA
jgi:hypothetical protein